MREILFVIALAACGKQRPSEEPPNKPAPIVENWWCTNDHLMCHRSKTACETSEGIFATKHNDCHAQAIAYCYVTRAPDGAPLTGCTDTLDACTTANHGIAAGCMGVQ